MIENRLRSHGMCELNDVELDAVVGGVAPLVIIVGKGLAQGALAGATIKLIELGTKYLVSS